MAANVVVPEVGESIVDARVARWLKHEGDQVTAGEPLVELETDKIDLEVAAPKGGVLSRIAHGDGADVKVGEVLGVIEEDAGRAERGTTDSSTAATPAATAGREAANAGGPAPQSGGPAAAASGTADAGRRPADAGEKKRATPAAKNAAAQNA